MEQPILAAREIVIKFSLRGRVLTAIRGASLDLYEGKTLAIVGESGSGKSVFTKSFIGMLDENGWIDSGSIAYGGRDLTALSTEQYRRTVRWSEIAVVFQGAMNSFNPVLRVGPQVGERLLLDGMPRAKMEAEVERLFELVGLTRDVARAYPHELSGGMKQRAAIASALSLNPSLVILDEPTSALDVSVQAQIMNLLKRLKWERGLSYLFITHDIALAADLADSIAVVHAGELREFGPADAVLTSPRDPYTERLLASVPRVHGEQAPGFLAGAPPDPMDRPAGCRFRPRCPRAFEPCATRPPELVEVGERHRARCWLYADQTRTAEVREGETS